MHLEDVFRERSRLNPRLSVVRVHWRASRQRHLTKVSAFTLLELLVVLALLVILAGSIVPRMSGSISRRELREAAGRFAHTARTVRELAVARQQVCSVRIDLDRGGYCVATQADRSQPGQWRVIQTSWLKARRWPKAADVAYHPTDGVTMRSGTQYLKFRPDGTSSGAAIRLARGQDAYRIVVHPHSGRVVCGDAGTDEFTPDRYDLGD